MQSTLLRFANKILDESLYFSESKDKEWGQGAKRYDIHLNGINVASAIVRPNPRKNLGGMMLSDLQTKDEFQGLGPGSKLLDFVISKYQGVDLYLRPQPYKSKTLSEKQLRRFYSKHGFVDFGDELMKYKQ
jgi:GNAT superfamily N-acetyltransferase